MFLGAGIFEACRLALMRVVLSGAEADISTETSSILSGFARQLFQCSYCAVAFPEAYDFFSVILAVNNVQMGIIKPSRLAALVL